MKPGVDSSALKTGYRHVDTAAYGDDCEVGQAIAHSDVDRSEVFIETKVQGGPRRT